MIKCVHTGITEKTCLFLLARSLSAVYVYAIHCKVRDTTYMAVQQHEVWHQFLWWMLSSYYYNTSDFLKISDFQANLVQDI